MTNDVMDNFILMSYNDILNKNVIGKGCGWGSYRDDNDVFTVERVDVYLMDGDLQADLSGTARMSFATVMDTDALKDLNLFDKVDKLRDEAAEQDEYDVPEDKLKPLWDLIESREGDIIDESYDFVAGSIDLIDLNYGGSMYSRAGDITVVEDISLWDLIEESFGVSEAYATVGDLKTILIDFNFESFVSWANG